MFRSQLGKFLVAFVMTWPALVQAQSALTTAVQPFVDRQELAGAVMLVANKEKVLAAEAVGWADVAAKSPMRTDSLFWMTSQSKPITACGDARRRREDFAR